MDVAKKAKGQLSFVSSVAGYMGLIGYSSYAPTKFALGGLAECVRMEATKDSITFP
ncbi:MAG: SDR family NAD(P)-dependent oxidoreductase [Bacteroidota bacterium]|nr:SDR family NAD(P)-dependent oxidoreductase [Bacteroidota bacterium]